MSESKYGPARIVVGGEVEFMGQGGLMIAYDVDTDEILVFDEVIRTRDSAIANGFDGLKAYHSLHEA